MMMKSAISAGITALLTTITVLIIGKEHSFWIYLGIYAMYSILVYLGTSWWSKRALAKSQQD